MSLETLNTRIAAQSTRSDAMDLLFDEVDDALIEGRIDDVRAWLQSAPASSLSIAQMLGALTVTSRERNLFSAERQAVVDRIRELDPDRADALTQGFQ